MSADSSPLSSSGGAMTDRTTDRLCGLALCALALVALYGLILLVADGLAAYAHLGGAS